MPPTETPVDTPASVARRRLLPRSLRVWTALAAVVIALAALVDVTVTGPRVTVLWRADITPADRVTDRARYVELAAKHFKLLTDKLEVAGSVDLIERLQRGRKRAQEQD